MNRLLMVLAIVLLLSVIVMGWALIPAMEKTFVPGVWVWDLSLAGMSPSEAYTHLAVTLPIQQPNVILVGPEGQRWSLSPADLGISVDLPATLARAYAIGHSGSGVTVLLERLDVMYHGERLSPILVWEQAHAISRLHAIAAEVARPASDAYIRSEGTALYLESGVVGRQMEVSATLDALLPALFALQPVEYVVPLTELQPQITDEVVSQALGIANAILAEPLTLLVADPREGDPGPWTVSPEVMAEMLRVDIKVGETWVGLDETALGEFFSPLEMALYIEPKDAQFHFDPETSQLIPLTDGYVGRALSVTASITKINEMLHAGQHFVPLVFDVIPTAYPDTITAEELGIRELVAVGESYFTGSSSARDKNIRLGASKFDGIMVAPDQVFSFNEYLGEVTPEEGYDESYVIIGNRTVPGVGGGICQVATTAFRAAYYSGLPIIERWPHAYRVGYYELGGYGPGFDATVYSPLVDFRFENDTPYHILIQTEADAARARLRFLFYSTDSGRVVEQIGPEWGESIPPGPDVYEFDPEMPAGTYERIENAHNGLNATLKRVVKDANDNILYQDTFVSNFVPWSARYRFGPDFVPPTDAEVIGLETDTDE
ncbi:MAG: VanW family protein [Anaerolineae bacterium]|nr:VanW family protein [Anaerolineae bacterium]